MLGIVCKIVRASLSHLQLFERHERVLVDLVDQVVGQVEHLQRLHAGKDLGGQLADLVAGQAEAVQALQTVQPRVVQLLNVVLAEVDRSDGGADLAQGGVGHVAQAVGVQRQVHQGATIAEDLPVGK